MAISQAAEAHQPQEYQESELERRLRSMRWPTPAPDVRERCFDELRARLDEAMASPPGRSG